MMDNSLNLLCAAIKKIGNELRADALSFIIVTGNSEQGKSSLLKQSRMEEVPLGTESHATLYYNQQGILLELGEAWLLHSHVLLQNTLKQLNKACSHLPITGLILCVDINTLLLTASDTFATQIKTSIRLLERIGATLEYTLPLALVFTKMDTLAGFAEFYQTEHMSELAQPLGFSLPAINLSSKKIQKYKQQFKQFIEATGQKVIDKIHPARTTIKRSLIREFPLQLASLHAPIQALIQALSPQYFNLQAIYFTSAEQGGLSIDRLNRKMQHEYALVVQDTFPQARNYRAYFVEGALQKIQQQCSRVFIPPKRMNKSQIMLGSCVVGLCLAWLGHTYVKSSHLLSKVEKDLVAYDAMHADKEQADTAMYQLSQAANTMDHMSRSTLALPSVHRLKESLRSHTKNKLEIDFLPSLLQELEGVIRDASNTPVVRYKALKAYLMLGQSAHFDAAYVQDWFGQQWKKQKVSVAQTRLSLLKQILARPWNNLPIAEQVVLDARNYLNALPTDYLYYALAKDYFSKQEQPINIPGFQLASKTLPAYFTKAGFHDVIAALPTISKALEKDKWVLMRQELATLNQTLTQVYCLNYLSWWQTFMRQSQPLHYQDYQQAYQVTQTMQEGRVFAQLVQLLQEHTKPDAADQDSLFNRTIANKFTSLHLMSPSNIQDVASKIKELSQFMHTLSFVNDEGRTAFHLTKLRFNNDKAEDPVSALFNQARQAPEPLRSWTKQLASESWSLMIKDTRSYINKAWKAKVYTAFQNTIEHKYPIDTTQNNDIALDDFNHFFSTHGLLNHFTNHYLRPFLDTTSAQWKPKVANGLMLPITKEALDEIIRAHVITNMFYADRGDACKIEFSLQKISLDPVVASLQLQMGDTQLNDNQGSESFTQFTWPKADVKLALDSIDGNHYELAEKGTWALFKLLEKVNVLVDEQDSASLQILFEINSNSGRYQLKTNNKVNPFTPGILNGFTLNEAIV